GWSASGDAPDSAARRPRGAARLPGRQAPPPRPEEARPCARHQPTELALVDTGGGGGATPYAQRQHVPAEAEPQHDPADEYFGEDAGYHEAQDEEECAADGQREQDHAAH